MPSDSDSSSSSPKKPTCVLDQTIVNAESLSSMKDIGVSFFASLCGMNRGAYVLDPSDGHTYSCLEFPPHFPYLAGVADMNRVMNMTVQENVTDTESGNVTVVDKTVLAPYKVIIKDANAIKDTYLMKNVTADETIQFLDYFIKMVYHSTPGKDADPYACNVNGLATLQCDPVNTIPTIRSATLAGLYVPALWATGGKTLTVKEQDEFYTRSDFEDMQKLGLNTVQIPVPVDAFLADPDQIQSRLANLLHDIGKADLKAIIVLTGSDNDEAVAAAAHYATNHTSVFALTLPSAQSITAARAAEQALKIMVPVTQSDLPHLSFNDPNIFAALNMDHSTSVADIASSTSEDDRGKLFYHEATACIGRSPLEFATCWKRVPVFVAKGFDLTIDNCVHKHDSAFTFVDYGQCGRFDETVGSGWWARHRKSFATRQIFSYEHGLGWSFAAWKLHGDSGSAVDTPASLLALKNVAAAGLLPSLDGDARDDVIQACLNGPEADFALGDKTLAPTMGPPPDCPNNGWWSYEKQACDYWVPPPTDAPTSLPTKAPIICPEVPPPVVCPAPEIDKSTVALSAGAGCIVTLLLGIVLGKIFGGKRNGYSSIPDSSVV
jgi:hypothetical protein